MNNELTAKVSEPTALQNPTPTELALLKRLEDCAVVMRGMADMMRTTNERMGALEREVRMLTKVTPAQATAINTAIRERAAALCLSYRATGCEKQAAAGRMVRFLRRSPLHVSSGRRPPSGGLARSRPHAGVRQARRDRAAADARRR